MEQKEIGWKSKKSYSLFFSTTAFHFLKLEDQFKL